MEENEVLERNNLSASHLGHLIPQKELLVRIELEAGVGFGASLAVFWMGEKSGNCLKSSPDPYINVSSPLPATVVILF